MRAKSALAKTLPRINQPFYYSKDHSVNCELGNVLLFYSGQNTGTKFILVLGYITWGVFENLDSHTAPKVPWIRIFGAVMEEGKGEPGISAFKAPQVIPMCSQCLETKL